MIGNMERIAYNNSVNESLHNAKAWKISITHSACGCLVLVYIPLKRSYSSLGIINSGNDANKEGIKSPIAPATKINAITLEILKLKGRNSLITLSIESSGM